MLKVLLLFIAVSYFSTAQTLPEGINRRIGNELDSTEADYFGLFSWVKGFKSGAISENNGELLFMISRQNAPDTVFTFSKKNAEYLNTYIARYEDIFTNPDIQKSIDWTEITSYLRPSNPIREAGIIAIKRHDNTSIERQVVWIGDSVIVVWKDDSEVSLQVLKDKAEIMSFNEIGFINNQPVLGNYQAFVNNGIKIRNHSWFVKMSPELRTSIVKYKSILSPFSFTNTDTSLNDVAPSYNSVKEQYFKRYTVSLVYYPVHIHDKKSYEATNTIYRYGAYKEVINTETVTTGAENNIRSWSAEILYNINPSISVGFSYSVPPAEYEPTRPLTNEPVLYNDPYNRDVVSGTASSLIFRYRPKPRDPILVSSETELGLAIGYDSYSVRQTRYYAGSNLDRTVGGSAWEAAAQLGYSYFFSQNIALQGGVLYRASTQISVPEADVYSKSYLLLKVNKNELRINEASFFISLRVHI